MASSDARPVPRKNTAYRVTFPLLDGDGDLVTGATGLDSEVSIDGATFTDCTNEATEIATSSGMYYLDLTSSEMNGDTVAIIVKTSSVGAKTTPIVLYPEELGDLRVDVGQISGDATAADNAESFFDGTGYAGTNNVIPTVTTTTTATNVTTVNGLAANVITATSIATDAIDADSLKADAVIEIQGGLATATNLATLQTSVDDLPTNAELATALGTADDATLAAIAALNNLSAAAVNAEVDTALADYDAPTKAELDSAVATLATATAVDDLPTSAELTTALAAADDATLAAIAALSIPSATTIADAVLSRDVSNVEDTADTTSLAALILATFESSASGTTWTIRKSAGGTFVVKTLTLDPDADAVIGVT